MRANHLKDAEQRFLVEAKCDGNVRVMLGRASREEKNTTFVKEIDYIFHGPNREERDRCAKQSVF